jgi:hypothetical protein
MNAPRRLDLEKILHQPDGGMFRPRVLNAKRVGLPQNFPDAVYVGRPSKWGNPFSIGPHGTRREVIVRHLMWLETQHDLLNSLHELKGKNLICWCAPEACHADILLQLANQYEPR